MINQLIACTKCGTASLPFDMFCDDCAVMEYTIKTGCKGKIMGALYNLGYSYEEDNTFSPNKFFFIISAPRKDQKALRTILNEL